MKSPALLTWSAISGVLLMAAWPDSGVPFLLFFAWLPLLLAEDTASMEGTRINRQFFMLALLSSLIWNLGTTWWIYFASAGGAAMAILTNTLLMASVFYLSHWTRVKLQIRQGLWTWPIFWIAFETLHHEWDIMWPWLSLGNGFAGHERWIQWYEYTGVQGGSLWIILCNLLLFSAWKKCRQSGPSLKSFLPYSGLVLLPILVSLGMFYSYREQGKETRVVLLQPNIDPYTEKFNGIPADEQLNIMLRMAEKKGLDNADLLVGPETAIIHHIWENELEQDPVVLQLRDFLKKFPKLNFLVGASTAKLYKEGEPLSETARKFRGDEHHWDSYNTGMLLNGQGPCQIYHKSKLVPGVEKMPWPWLFKHIEDFAIDLGGISGSLGVQNGPSVFRLSGSTGSVAPIICYESVFPDYVGEYVRQGATLLAIITNDGWWSDSPGYRQHLKLGAIRAIETRRSIVRSANTGISCFINQRGEILQPSEWWQPATLSGTVKQNTYQTVFVQFGNLTGKAAIMSSLILFLAVAVKSLRKSQKP